MTTDVNPTPYQSAAPIHYGTTAQPNPTPGDLWYDISEGDLKIYYSDNNSSQWVSITSNSGSERNLEITQDILENEAKIQTQATEIGSLKETIDLLKIQLENLQNQVVDIIANQ